MFGFGYGLRRLMHHHDADIGLQLAPEATRALNPAFDVTPAELITAIVTDRRVVRLDRGEKLSDVPLGERRISAEQ